MVRSTPAPTSGRALAHAADPVWHALRLGIRILKHGGYLSPYFVTDPAREGIVPGGGLPLLRAIEAIRREEAQSDGDERTGLRILAHALEAPTRQIAENSGVDGGVVVDRMRSGSGNFGFDAGRNAYVDLVEAGIIDPTKVLRIALENAVSVASVLLLTEATLTEIPQPKGDHTLPPE